MKKTILIAPPNDFAGNVNVARFTSLLAPPLGIVALGSYLSAHGVPVELVDVQMDFGFGLTRDAERIVFQRVVRHLCDQGDDIAWVGISQLSNAGTGVAIAREIHNALPDTPIIFGGYFPSGAYRSLLQEYPFITAIVRGDGEAAALDVGRRLAQGLPFPHDEIPNLVWLDGNGINATPSRPMQLHDLPILDFGLLHNPSSYQIIDLMTSRGCPFRCNYCLESSMRPYATHSPSWVDQQLAHLKAEMPNDHVFIYDPVFGLGRKRTLEMCQTLRKHRFTYAVESRVDVLTPDLVPTLRQAGVETIYLGIESASVETLLRMNKLSSAARARSYLAGAVEVLKACFRCDVTPVSGFMLGFPGDTETDYQVTLEFVKDVRELHDQITAQTGIETGFVPFVFYTKIYEGSSLAESVTEAFPDAVLRPEPFIGENAVLSPTPGLGLDVAQRYQAEIVRHSAYTPLALERLLHYFSFSMEAFLAEYPELVDDQGVVVLGDCLRRFPQTFGAASTLTHYDKSRKQYER
jgi:anaerobic magnesium-protoporphyrin IX monomethyl ester cyclase